MLRRLALLALLCSLSASAVSAQDLEVWFLDVGQGDGTLLVGPTGKTFLFDAGPDGSGYSVVVPKLNALGITHLDYVGASHYHSDHVGGLDEVWDSGIHATVALDRGPSNPPNTSAYSDYANRYASVRQTVSPGQVVDLGGGATLTCLVVEGRLLGGGSVNISGSNQWENSASIAWKVEYGDFDLFLGGDLTGGGNFTTDVESQVGALCGDVDVYQLDHHASRTSTNQTFVNEIHPEFAVIPCGTANSYGFPKQEVVDRLNTAARVIPLWSLTDGVGTEGFLDAGGNIHLITDGSTYTVSAADGTSFTAHVDEQSPTPPAAGELVVGEFQRDPARSSDSDGEYVELSGARTNEAVPLDSVTVTDDSGDSFTIGASLLLAAGETLAAGADGLPSRNGGFRPVLVWPNGSFSLANGNDRIRLRRSTITLDQVDYDSGWPGGAGISAERRDLLGGAVSSNFAAAVGAYGSGDKGTPGTPNDADTTNWGGGTGGVRVEFLSQPIVGTWFDMNWYAPGEAGYLYQGWITLGTSPGVNVNGYHIPANIDAGWDATSTLPGWSGFVPANEVMQVGTTVPNDSNLTGLPIWAVFVTYQDIFGQGITIREVGGPEPTTIQ